MRVARLVAYSSMLLGVLGMTACADLQTVGRTTRLPLLVDANNSKVEPGVAIHLDAQQRLVLARGEKYCAEPSPDALAAYASSLGFGVSAPGQGAASLAQALQSSAGSIGLRTQSITLMRDALYRMCEAANNGDLNRLEVAMFLRRSQDLTAAVLAIEQLTGAVVAQQVILTGNANAAAAASLLSNQAAVEEAGKRAII